LRQASKQTANRKNENVNSNGFHDWCDCSGCGSNNIGAKTILTIGTIMRVKSNSKVRNGFSRWSTGSSHGCYYPTKGHAVNAFDGELQGHDLCLRREELLDFNGDEGRKIITIVDEFDREQGRAVLSWYRMDSGRYEFTGYIA
jgi:hypothetical protein